MGEIIGFEYKDLDADTSGFVREAAGRIRVRLQRSSQDIVEIGTDLISVQGKIGRTFEGWCETEFGMSRSTAYNFITVAKKFSKNSPIIGQLAPTALYALTHAEAETVAEVEQMSQNGETVTASVVKELRAKNKKLREERDIARLEGDTRTAFAEEASQKLHDTACEVQYLTKEIERITSENTIEAKVTHDDALLRQALMGFWQQLPPETQEWFLGEVSK